MVATYGAYDIVKTQYDKNLDIANMHTSGRAIMRIIERDVRMAGFEYRDNDAKVTYGTISSPLTIKDSGNKCCDEVTVVYDYFDEEAQTVERIRIRYWTEAYSNNKGARHRLYKRTVVLGQNNAILGMPIIGAKTVMADYIEDLQLSDANESTSGLSAYTGEPGSNYLKIDKNGKVILDTAITWSCAKNKKTGLIWEVKTKNGLHDKSNKYTYTSGDRWGNMCYGYKSGVVSTYCNTQAYINKINSKALCGFSDWKLPSRDELLGLIDKRYSSPAVDWNFFPNTNIDGSDYYVSSTLRGGNIWLVRYSNKGNDAWGFKHRKSYIRLSSKGLKSGSNLISLLSINLTLRTKNQYGKDRQFKKKDYHAGNYKLDKTDKYKRDTFSSTVLVRNLAL
jgi:hypothetical protein